MPWLSIYPNVTTYLAGLGAKKYMGDERSEAMFDEQGIKVVWANHDAPTGDSIVSVIADYEDPLEIIMRTKDEGDTE